MNQIDQEIYAIRRQLLEKLVNATRQKAFDAQAYTGILNGMKIQIAPNDLLALLDEIDRLQVTQEHTHVELAGLRAERDALKDVLLRHGFVECDIAACNCGSWHARYGLRERMGEMRHMLEDAGHPLSNANGNLIGNALKELVAERDALRAFAQEVISHTGEAPTHYVILAAVEHGLLAQVHPQEYEPPYVNTPLLTGEQQR